MGLADHNGSALLYLLYAQNEEASNMPDDASTERERSIQAELAYIRQVCDIANECNMLEIHLKPGVMTELNIKFRPRLRQKTNPAPAPQPAPEKIDESTGYPEEDLYR